MLSLGGDIVWEELETCCGAAHFYRLISLQVACVGKEKRERKEASLGNKNVEW